MDLPGALFSGLTVEENLSLVTSRGRAGPTSRTTAESRSVDQKGQGPDLLVVSLAME